MEVAKKMPDKTNVSYYSENWISLSYKYIIPLKTTTHLISSELYRMFIFFKNTVIERILCDDTTRKPGK